MGRHGLVRIAVQQQALDFICHTCFRWHLRPQQITGDTTYGTVEHIVTPEHQRIRTSPPLPDFAHRSPCFGKAVFTDDETKDHSGDPEGALLRRRTDKYTVSLIEYRANAAVCNACPLKAGCTASEHGRRVHRSLFEAYLDRVRGYHTTEACQQAVRKRRVWVEPLFGETKQWYGLGRFRLRGLVKVNGEALVIAAGQNLKRLLSRRGWGRRPWPSGASGLRLTPATEPLRLLTP